MSEERKLSKNYLASGILCCVLSCKISRRRCPNAKLFKFPPTDSVFGQIWREKCNIPQGDYDKQLYVCDKHFESTYLGSRRLKGDAIPTLFLGRQISEAENFELNLKQHRALDCYRELPRKQQSNTTKQLQEEQQFVNKELPESAPNMEATEERLAAIKCEVIEPHEMETNITSCNIPSPDVDQEFYYTNIKSEYPEENDVLSSHLENSSDMEETNDRFSEQQYEIISGEEMLTTSTQCSTTPSSDDELLCLLKEWKLSHIYDHLTAECVTIDVLKIIKIHHLERLLSDLDIGTQVYFEYYLEKWRESIGAPLLNMYAEASLFRPMKEKTSFVKSHSPPPLLSTVKKTNLKCKTAESCPSRKITTLAIVLNSTKRGRLLAQYYDNCHKFNEEHRTALISTIAQYFDDNNLHMSLRRSYILEKEILEKFPTEKLEFYRTSNRGKLFNKFCAIKNFTKSLNTNLKIQSNKIEAPCSNATLVAEENAEQMVKAVKDDKLSFLEMQHNWRACSQYRILEMRESASIKTILNNWPQYKLPHGHQLIDIDFNVLFPNNPSILETWHIVENALFDILSNMSNQILRDALKDFDSLSKNSREALLLWSSHACLVPLQNNLDTNLKGKNNNIFSIIDSQSAFMMQYASLQALQDEAQLMKERCSPPFLMVVGNFRSINEIYVYFEGITMPFDSCLKAVDICFKIFHLFNLSYPRACASFWNFIQTYFYKMHSKESFVKVNILCNALKKFE